MTAFLKEHPNWWNPDLWLAWLMSPFRMGFLGVQLLFVLSGYCIHRNQAKALAAGEDVRLNLGHYAFRRFFRIYPTYVAALAFSGLILYALIPWLVSLGYPMPTDHEKHSWYVLGMNLLTMQDILVPPYVDVFWSLSIEIHLYVVYPIVLWVTRRYGPAMMLKMTLAAAILHMGVGYAGGNHAAVRQTLAFLHFMIYWFTWCIGAYIAEIQFGRAKPIRMPQWAQWAIYGMCAAVGAGLSVVAKELGAQVGHGAEQGRLPLMAVGEVLMAVAIGGGLWLALRPEMSRIWSSMVGRMLAFVGMFSFSLYAVHRPILVAFTVWWGGQSHSMLPPLLGCLCAIGIAYLFFHVVERWTLMPPKGFLMTKKVPPTAVASVEPVLVKEKIGR